MTFNPEETITTEKRLRELLPCTDSRNVLEKDLDHINEIAGKFIELSPFAILATKGKDGSVDVSPRGDPVGFVEVYDENTLILPDRLGNDRADSMMNILENPDIGLIFVIPGHTETLRVVGRARIVHDKEIQTRHAINGREPLLALVIDVDRVFMHCSKAFVRSGLWRTETWGERRAAPSLAEWVEVAVPSEYSIDDLQEIHDNDAKTRLY